MSSHSLTLDPSRLGAALPLLHANAAWLGTDEHTALTSPLGLPSIALLALCGLCAADKKLAAHIDSFSALGSAPHTAHASVYNRSDFVGEF